MKKTLLTVGMTLAMTLAGSSAFAEFKDFKVNESVVSTATTPKNFTADKINGAYVELLQALPGQTFAASAFATFDAYRSNEGTTPIVGEMVGYTLYAVFQAAGNITGVNQFTGTSGSISLYLDRNQDTAGTLVSGLLAATLSNTGDDDLIGSSAYSYGTGNLSANPGAYALYFEEVTLTEFGKTYFYSPDPFFDMALSNGDNDVFTATGRPGEFRVTGDTSIVFVPEPGSLALMGLALAGLGFTQRRRKSA